MDGDKEFRIQEVNPLEVELDPANPRLDRDDRGSSQADLRETLIRKFKLDELGESIVASVA